MAGITQEEAAERVGIKVQVWQKYEYGTRSSKDPMLEKIASVLGVDISVLTTFSGKVYRRTERRVIYWIGQIIGGVFC